MSELQKTAGYVLATGLMAILLGSVLAAPAFSAYADNGGKPTGFLPLNNTPHLPPTNGPAQNTPQDPPKSDPPKTTPHIPPQNGPKKNSPSVPLGSTLPKNPPGDYAHQKCAKNSTLCFPLAPAICKHGDTLPNGKYRHNCRTDQSFT